MNAAAALTLAIRLLDLVPLAIAGEQAIQKAIEEGRGKLRQMVDQGRDPTSAEWAELHAELDRLESQLHRSAVGGTD